MTAPFTEEAAEDAIRTIEATMRDICQRHDLTGVSADQFSRASGWTLIGEAGGGRWSRTERPRVDDHPTQPKLRWERAA